MTIPMGGRFERLTTAQAAISELIVSRCVGERPTRTFGRTTGPVVRVLPMGIGLPGQQRARVGSIQAGHAVARNVPQPAAMPSVGLVPVRAIQQGV